MKHKRTGDVTARGNLGALDAALLSVTAALTAAAVDSGVRVGRQDGCGCGTRRAAVRLEVVVRHMLAAAVLCERVLQSRTCRCPPILIVVHLIVHSEASKRAYN